MTIRVFCRWIGEHALRGFVRAEEVPDMPLVTAPRPIKVLAICPKDHDHLVLRMAAFHYGWDLSLARSLADATALLRRTAYSIVLYDADLPSPGWPEAVRRLASPGYDRIVILLSARTPDELFPSAIQLGAFDVLEKPILGTELLAVVSDAHHFLETLGTRTAI